MRKPFLFILIPYSLGLIMSYFIETNIVLLYALFIAITILGVITFMMKKQGANMIIFLSLFILGAIVSNYHLNKSILLNFKGETLEVQGIVREILTVDKNYTKAEFEVTTVKLDRSMIMIREKTSLNIKGNLKINKGDIIKFQGTIDGISRNGNPYLFNYRTYMFTKGVYTNMSATSYSVKILSKENPTLGDNLSINFEERVNNIFDNNLKSNNSSIMKSIILGNSSYLDEETQGKFRDLGLGHILAVSGLHVGLIFLFIMYILQAIGLQRNLSVILSVIAIWAYGYMIGLPASVVRASIMFSLLSLSSLIYRRYDSINIIAFTGTIMLIIRPLWILNIGFQISFVATASIILLTPKINKIFKQYKMTNIGKSLAPLIGVQLGTLPIVAYYFNNYSVMSIVANIIIIPLISLALILSLSAIILSYIFMPLVRLLGPLINIILDFNNFLVDKLDAFPLSPIILSSPSLGRIIVYYVIIFLALGYIKVYRIPKMLVKAVIIYTLVMTLVGGIIYFIDDEISVEFIDVGQGDCALIRSRYGNFLVDTGGSRLGGYDVGGNIVLPYLQKSGVKAIDGVFISHFHEDHCEGLLSIIGNIKIKRIFIPYENFENKLFNDIINLAKDIEIIQLQRGDLIDLGKSMKINVIYPDKEAIRTLYTNENNISMVKVLSAHGKDILFTGDIEREAEGLLISQRLLDKIDILKVPHHGSKTSSTKGFVDALNPQYAIIQVGRNNFGHPSPEVLDRFASKGTQVFRNDTEGLVTLKIARRNFEVIPYIKEKPRLITIIIDNKIEITAILLIYLIFIQLILHNEKNFRHKGCIDEL